jgi:SEC-C motif
MLMSYRPTDAGDPCPCGSGKSFGDCCQPLPYWRPLCPNPDGLGFSVMHPQSARFTNVPVDKVYEFLQNDARLYCTEDSPERGFWTYWGDPAFDCSYGTFCFGDFELQEDHTLLITALSDARMEVLLELVRPLELGTPQIEQEPFSLVEKPVQKFPARRRRRTR